MHTGFHGGLDGGQHPGQAVPARQGEVPLRVDGVQGDVHPVQAGLPQPGDPFVQAQAVGGQGGAYRLALIRAQRSGGADDVLEVPAQEGFTTGETDLTDAELLHGDADQTDGLLIGEGLFRGHPFQALGRHAVGAPQVAAVGERDPEVTGDPPETVHQHTGAIRPGGRQIGGESSGSGLRQWLLWCLSRRPGLEEEARGHVNSILGTVQIKANYNRK